MSFHSEAQREKFRQLVKEGKMTQAKFDEWEAATGKRKLPERSSSKVKLTKLTKVIK